MFFCNSAEENYQGKKETLSFKKSENKIGLQRS